MPTLESLQIVNMAPKRSRCPLCEVEDALKVIPHEDGFLFNCLACGQNGSTSTGWFDDTLEEGYATADYHMDKVREIYTHGLQRGITTGWGDLDEYFTLRPGEVTVIAGIPGHGKSTWLANLSINASHIHNWKWAIYSPEMEPYELYLALSAEKFVGKEFFPTTQVRMDISELSTAIDWMNERFYFLKPKKRDLFSILDRSAYLIRKRGVNAIIIDPWNRLEHSRPDGMREDEYISLCMDQLTDFAKRNKVCVFLVVHPAKMKPIPTKDGRPAPEPVPSVFDLKGASEWNSKADNVLCVYRDRSKPDNVITEIHAQKIRWRLTGKDGSIELEFIPTSQRYKRVGGMDRAPIKDAKSLMGA